MSGFYDVEVNLDGGWSHDWTTGSKWRAVARARHIASAYPWQRQALVRIVHGFQVVDFNLEP